MKRIRRQFAFAVFTMTAIAVTSSAQENPCLVRTVTVNVLSNEYEGIKGLTAANFRARFQGHDVEIVSATAAVSPRRVVFLIDTGAAMLRDEARWRSEVVMAEGLVSWLRELTSVALLTFSNSMETKVDFSQGRKTVNTELTRLERAPHTEPAGKVKTNLVDALLDGKALLTPPSSGDAVCLITDGDAASSQLQMDDVQQKLLAAGIRLFGLLPESALASNAASSADAGGAKALRELVESTGGDYLIFSSSPKTSADSAAGAPLGLTDKDREAMVVASRGLAREMDQFYSVQFRLPEPANKSSDWTLELVNLSGNKESHLRVIYPRRLAKCP